MKIISDKKAFIYCIISAVIITIISLLCIQIMSRILIADVAVEYDPYARRLNNDSVVREIEEGEADNSPTISDADELPRSNVGDGVVVEDMSVIKNARITAYSVHDAGVNCAAANTADICNIISTYGIVACPAYLDFGDKVKIKGKTYVCMDRMSYSHRHQDHYDIWFNQDLDGALEWGVQYHDVEIVE